MGVAGTVVVGGFATWYLAFRDVAEPATVGEAVTSFREHPGSAAAVPPGVYVYATRGFERIDALAGARHPYPSRSTITVTGDPCGVQMRWDVLRGRSTTWSLCIRGGGWTLASQDERHTFFGHTDFRSYACRDFAFWTRARSASYDCVRSDASEHGIEALVGVSRVRVGGAVVSTVHLHRTSSFTGSTRGTSTYDFWLDPSTGVPVRVVMSSRTTNDSAIGAVHYEEHVALRLASLTPRR
jgi:hypothetical protein